jgi:hypothetical protein
MKSDEKFRDVHDVTYLGHEVVGPPGSRRTVSLVSATVAVGISFALGGTMMNVYEHGNPAARSQPHSQFEPDPYTTAQHHRSWNQPGPYDSTGCPACEWTGHQ